MACDISGPFIPNMVGLVTGRPARDVVATYSRRWGAAKGEKLEAGCRAGEGNFQLRVSDNELAMCRVSTAVALLAEATATQPGTASKAVIH